MPIKLITSATFSQRMQDAFNSGLSDSGHGGHAVEFQAIAGKYDDLEGTGAGAKQELYTAFSNADNDLDASGNAAAAPFDLIISAGGLVSAHAAQKSINRKPFLVLIGQLPKFHLKPDNFFGGVNLDMVGQNIVRHDFLVGRYDLAGNKICQIWNKNSKMGKFEKKEWSSRNWPAIRVDDNTDAEITGAIDKAVNQRYQGIVISGDPHFTSRMDVLVNKANSSGLITCYPLNAYAYSSHKPKSGFSMIYGPDLEYAYRQLGRKAGTILSSLADPPDTGLDSCPTVGPLYL